MRTFNYMLEIVGQAFDYCNFGEKSSHCDK